MNIIDRIIGWLDPVKGINRAVARRSYDKVQSRANPAKNNRLTNNFRNTNVSGDFTSAADMLATRERAWELYEENPHARKIVRILTAQVFGSGLAPKSEAMRNGKPWKEFRVASKKLWKRWTAKWDWHGSPMQGGFGYVGMTQQITRELVVGGEAFIVLRRLTSREAKKRGLPIPLAIELLGSEWLVDDFVPGVPGVQGAGTNFVYRGIEYDSQNRRVAYHFRKVHPSDPRWIQDKTATVRVAAEDVLHLYERSRTKQERGQTWFKAAILRLKNIDDYDMNELMAAATAAMPTLVSKTETPMSSLGGIPSTEEDTDDVAGNRTTNLQAVTLVQLRKGEEFSGFAPQRPNPNAEGFGTYSLRSVASNFPGVKASSIHMDYRQASFASERAADNDVWRETAGIQAWVAECAFQPLWEAAIETGVLSGWFSDELDGRGFSEGYFYKNRAELEVATWTGPVARTINPLQEANATQVELQTGVMAYPEAVAQYGGDYEETLASIVETYQQIESLELPDGVKLALINQLLGVKEKPPEVYSQSLKDVGLEPTAQEVMDHETELAESGANQEDTADGPQGEEGGQQNAA